MTKKIVSLLEIILLGNPYNLTTSLQKNCNIGCIMCLLKDIKCAFLKKLSITTKNESLPFYILCNTNTKFILTKSHSLLGIGSGLYNAILWLVPTNILIG